MKKKTLYLKTEEEGTYGEIYLLKQKKRFRCKTESRTVEKIFEEHDQLIRKVNDRNQLIEEVLKRIQPNFETFEKNIKRQEADLKVNTRTVHENTTVIKKLIEIYRG